MQPHHPGTLLRLLRGLYGADRQGGRYLEPLQPDLLGEQLVAETLAQDGGLLGRVLDGGSDAEASSTLTVLTRLAQRQPELGRWLRAAFQGRLEQLAGLALDVAVGTGDPIGLALAEELQKDIATEVVFRLQERCDDVRYRYSIPLREVACAVTEQVLLTLKKQQGSLDESQMRKLFWLALHLGIRLSNLGRREEALCATEEAVEIYRQLAQTRPDDFLPDLATSLNNLGIMLSALGCCKEALRAAQEAVEIRRQLAQTRPDASLPHLASSLNNLGTSLRELGRREDALHVTQEAVEIRRQLARTRPEAFLPDLAESLNNLGNMLSDLDRPEEAFLAGEEAARTLAPFFLRLPAAFASWMGTMVRNYRKRAEAAGKEPDEAFLAPIVEVLQSLPASQDAGE